jgi:hypothetical protein
LCHHLTEYAKLCPTATMPAAPHSPQPWAQFKALFEDVADLSPSERELRIAMADASDATRQEVRSHCWPTIRRPRP